mgnify:CR=1 FL=1
MSVYNKASDRYLNGRIDRKRTRREKHWRKPNKWFRKLFCIRPKRRKNKVLCMKIMQELDLDYLTYPLANNKPQNYHQ